MTDTLSGTIDKVLNGANADISQLQREQIKQELRELIEKVDSGDFRGAIITSFDHKTKRNVTRLWGDRAIVNESAIRVLHAAGLVKPAG